jgi:predicted dehydrogenase
MARLRCIVAGCGGRAVGWLIPALSASPDTEVVALCDDCVPRADYAARSCPSNPRTFRSVEDALGAVDCDVVAVTTGDAHHAEVVLPALAAGKTVFCEKPLETTLEKCQAIVRADEAAGGRVFVGFNLRYAPVYDAVRAEIDRGTLGRVLTIQMDEFYDGGRTYFRRWNRLRSEGGGLWITKASHDFDLMAWIAGAPPAQVSAFASRTYYVPKPGAAAQCRFCRLAPTCPDRAPATPHESLRIWEENGGPPHDLCLFNTESDTFDHGIATVRFEGEVLGTYTCNVVTGFTDRRIRVSGTRGTLDGSLSADRLTLVSRDPSKTVEIAVGGDRAMHGGADGFVLESFLAFARGETEPRCRPREAATAIRLGLAATRSADEGRTVPMSEFSLA